MRTVNVTAALCAIMRTSLRRGSLIEQALDEAEQRGHQRAIDALEESAFIEAKWYLEKLRESSSSPGEEEKK